MSKSERNERLAFVTLVGAISVIILLLSYQFGREAGRLETEPHEHASAYKDRTDEDIEIVCLSRDTIEAAIKCATQQKNQSYKANEEHRANHDLTAQRAMARYAWWMVFIAFASLLAAIGGIYYLRKTLFETRRIGQAEVRAYLSIVIGSYSISGNDIRFTVGVTNNGQSPSRGGKISCKIRGSGGIDDTYFTYTAQCDDRVVPDLTADGSFSTDEFTIKDTDIIISGGSAGNIIADIKENIQMLFFDIQLDWLDVFDNQQTITANLIVDPRNHCLRGIGEYPAFRKLEVKTTEYDTTKDDA